MIDFSSPEYLEARWRVKINHFTEQGLQINGIVHVGTNDGYEMHWYKMMGIKHLIGVEPLPSAQELFGQKHPDLPLFGYALSDHDGIGVLHPTEGDGQGSSLLIDAKPNPDYKFLPDVHVIVRRWDSIVRESVGFDFGLYDCLVMDVQGYEWEALHGFGDQLKHFNMINVELSEEPIYVGGRPAREVVEWLATQGFNIDSPITEHDDVFFIREGLEVPFPGRRIQP
ncbi:MAG: FkbM family methyltransferase [Methanomicrobiales archaeon]|nr:FkbM family methyltransferase [Methanomicrobiales archaeon]